MLVPPLCCSSALQAVAHPQSLAWFASLVDNSTEAVADVVPEVNSTDVVGEVGNLLNDLKHQSFAGPAGFVVMWLKVEGITALGLPLLSSLMMLLGFRDHFAVGCILFVIAVFQACWLAVGCFWSFGHYVPDACQQGMMGDNFAFSTMWSVPSPTAASTLTRPQPTPDLDLALSCIAPVT